MEESQDTPNDRKALAFYFPEQVERNNEDEDDNFYELTLDEFKSLYNSLQKQKAIQDNLLPRSKREEEEAKLRPPKRDYQWTVIRIEFPSRIVLQGQFKPKEKIADVKEFVREHMKEPGTDFNLFTSPPKMVPLDDATLADLGFVPSVKLYVDVKNGSNCELLMDRMNLASFNSAQLTASSIRKPVEKEPIETKPSSSKAVLPTDPSTSIQSLKKVPKWFKMKK